MQAEIVRKFLKYIKTPIVEMSSAPIDPKQNKKGSFRRMYVC